MKKRIHSDPYYTAFMVLYSYHLINGEGVITSPKTNLTCFRHSRMKWRKSWIFFARTTLIFDTEFFDTDMIPFSRIISVNVTSLSLYSVTIPLS